MLLVSVGQGPFTKRVHLGSHSQPCACDCEDDHSLTLGETEIDGGTIVSPDVRPETGASTGAGASETMIAGSSGDDVDIGRAQSSWM